MATVIAVLGMLASLIPVLVEVLRAKFVERKKATEAIRDRDRAELRAGLERVRPISAPDTSTDKPVLPPGPYGL